MTELLLFFSCYNGAGCQKSLDTYIYYNPKIVSIAEAVKDNVEKRAAPYYLPQLLPVASILYNRSLVIRPVKNTTIQASTDKISFNYNASW
jgi:hypothetical protein